MSVKFDLTQLPKKIAREVVKKATVKIITEYTGNSFNVKIYKILARNIFIPFALGKRYEPLVDLDISAEPSGFLGTLRDHQVVIAKEALEILKRTNSVIISAFTGMGKTIVSLYLACVLGYKTLIITNRNMLVGQWKDSVTNFCPGLSVQHIKPTNPEMKPEARFLIVNPSSIHKFPVGFFNDIKLVIVDELHQIISPNILKELFNLLPFFVIGLSATPYRNDGYNACIALFFGTNMVGPTLFRKHDVYVANTSFTPDPCQDTETGGEYWGRVLNEQAENVDRNALICSILQKLPERHWLVLVKRIMHATLLKEMLTLRGIECELLVGNITEYDRNARIIIGTVSKVGVGYDNPNIDALFVAADIKAYFIQSLGRCMRKQETKPIVIDLIDCDGNLCAHYKAREAVYKKHGGNIKKLN